MAITFFRKQISKEERKKYFALVFVLIMGISILLVWQWFLKKKGIISVPEMVKEFQEAPKVDFTVFDKPILRRLKPFKTIEPLSQQELRELTGKKGFVAGDRENPFEAYKIPKPLSPPPSQPGETNVIPGAGKTATGTTESEGTTEAKETPAPSVATSTEIGGATSSEPAMGATTTPVTVGTTSTEAHNE